ncbi:hypothetical protein Y032_0314g2248 [Ancylostoma ceylanicum]|uniref:Uncharacterized protein n=1 Tax=Ancylostoma ceylanicum TaxID=53326 RepID=A0A016S292_9BILA|nr:hypothetical protein Y032_0314g2248 [Ancylostoma ceylanicum]
MMTWIAGKRGSSTAWADSSFRIDDTLDISRIFASLLEQINSKIGRLNNYDTWVTEPKFRVSIELSITFIS